LKHHASSDFWNCFTALPKNIRELARKNFELLKQNPSHPSLHLKKIGDFVLARVGSSYRVLGRNVPDGILWFWIGSHADYDKIIGS
jgi:hypothetical protein